MSPKSLRSRSKSVKSAAKSEKKSAKKSRSKSVRSRLSSMMWNHNSHANLKSGSKKNFIQANIAAVSNGRSAIKKSGGANSRGSSVKSLLKNNKGSKTNIGRGRSNFKTPSLGSASSQR